MEPFSTAPIFSFLVEETWDGSSQTLLVYEGQRIPVDLTLAENNELKEGYLYQFVGRQEIGDVQEELF
jgi:hypothetical protein